MNKYEHAANSAMIFGGDPKEYQPFHALIDSNKVVTPSIFGRFFLHHMDIGLPILEAVFGKTIGEKQIPAKDLLAQHLIEDYGQVLTFADHWAPALSENRKLLPKLDDWDSVLEKAAVDPRLAGLSWEHLKELDNIFLLRVSPIPISAPMTDKNIVFAIFGHALGGDLLARIMEEKFHGIWTSDAITGFLNCRFAWADRNRDRVPTLLDYERYVPDKPWMHAPREIPGNQETIKKKIAEHSKRTEKEVMDRSFDFLNHRQPCNLD